MTQLKALIFDVDGTLAETERDGHRVAFNLAFKEKHLDWYWDAGTYERLLDVAGGKERIRFFMDEADTSFNVPIDPEAFVHELHQRKARHYASILKSGSIPLRPGVERLLNEARAMGLRLAIATTSSQKSVISLLKVNLGAESIGWFDVIAAGDIVGNKKPDPDIYLYALERLKLPAGNCIAFEDSEIGLLSSVRAGLKTVVTVNAGTRHQKLGKAEIVLDQLGEPGAAFEVLAGDAGGAAFVDIPMIQRIFKS